MFQINPDELLILKYQFGTSRLAKDPATWGGRRKLPLVFTEQGVAMLSTVLRSEIAIMVNIEIMRTFVRLRDFLLSNQDLALKLNDLESKYDNQFKIVFDAIRELMTPPDPPTRKIGIKSD